MGGKMEGPTAQDTTPDTGGRQPTDHMKVMKEAAKWHSSSAAPWPKCDYAEI
jgi:hypothetical protein